MSTRMNEYMNECMNECMCVLRSAVQDGRNQHEEDKICVVGKCVVLLHVIA